MRLNLTAIPGQKVEVELPADAGFPVDLQFGDDRAPAFVEKRRTRTRRTDTVEVSCWRLCPPLGAGTHRVIVHDRTGSREVGTVTIGRG